VNRRAFLYFAATLDLTGTGAPDWRRRTGTVFTQMPPDPGVIQAVTEISIPAFPNMHAIWGGMGRDNAGHLWFGVCAADDGYSAHLFEFDPVARHMEDRGDVVSALKAADQLRRGEGQIKIHSKILQADDGHMYFTSTDEEGEREETSSPPRWGSHFWRYHRPEGRWDHLLAVPEGLTAATVFGHRIYALGLWNHVLYRYDIRSGDVARVVVGSPPGHMSRNLLVDSFGHVYAPRVRPTSYAALSAELVEFDSDLHEVAATPLQHYATRGLGARYAHGILSFTYLADGSLVFASSVGFLYRIVPRQHSPATVESLGWFDPSGSAYTWDGVSRVAGLTDRATRAPPHNWQWVVFDLHKKTSISMEFPYSDSAASLLYGSNTRDNQGRFYVVGRRDRTTPLILQVDAGQPLERRRFD
jgi:hypothetical protein